MNLIIVESPTKARTLNRFLGNHYQIMASMGHIRDLPKSQLGIDIPKDFKPAYQIVEGKEEIVKKLIVAGKKASKIFLATDPDREGEAIAFHVKHIMEGDGKFFRITFHEITKKAILESLEHPGKISQNLVSAQQTRRILDRLVGYKLSPLLWRKVRKGLSAGRVQSVTVRLIVEREREIEDFKPVEYWEIGVELRKKDKQGTEFIANLYKIEGRLAKVGNKKKAEGIVNDLKKASYVLDSVTKREITQNPPPPFITSTLQRMGANVFGWSSKKTMREAQRLYENGYITYHRTDSFNLASQALANVREYIEKKFGKQYLPDNPRIFKARSRLAQEAHEAIRPTKFNRDEKRIEKRVGRPGYKLYQVIKKRFLACQMAASLIDKTTLDVTTGKYLMRAIGEIEKFDGWRKIYQNTVRDTIKKQGEEDAVRLPEVSVDEQLQLIKVLSEQKFTQPPPRYTESTLIKTLEKLGIGRPSTYAPTVSTIQNRGYVEKNEGKFNPTLVGIAVTKFLEKYFPKIMDYQFTAQMEDELDKIAQAKRKWNPVVSEFYSPFSRQLEAVNQKAKRVKIETEKTGRKCPECDKGEVVIRLGRFGKFQSCSRFPECRYTENYVEKIGMKCPGCQKGEVIIRLTKRGKQFYGCSSYPECKWASWKKPK